MKLDSLFSTILNNFSTLPKNEQLIQGKLSLVDFLGQGINIKSGQILQISFDSTNLTLNISSNDGLKTTTPQTSLSIENFSHHGSEPLVIEAKVSSVQNNIANLQLLNINKQSVSQYIKPNQDTIFANETSDVAVIKDTTNPINIQLKSISADSIIKIPVNVQNLPEQAKLDLQTSLQQIKIKLSIDELSLTPRENIVNKTQEQSYLFNTKLTQIQSNADTILHMGIKDIITQPHNAPEIINKTVQNIKILLQDLVGTTVPAHSSVTLQGESIFTTIFGDIKPEISLQLPQDLEAIIKITDIIKEANVVINKVDTPQEKILQILEPLKTQNTQLYNMIMSKFPSANNDMLVNLKNFTKASVQGDIRQWLGNELMQELENQGAQGKLLINELQNTLQGSSRNTPLWRIVEIPFYAENHMNKIKLAVKQYPEEDSHAPENRDKFGTRFVVDTEFTNLGAFQFDGFSFAKDRRFDLVIRTQRDIGNDIYANIIKIFKTTLQDVQYIGNVKINLKENFIKISEDNTEDKFISQDLIV